MILPSKKVLALFIVVVAFVVGIMFAFSKEKTESAVELAGNIVAGEKIRVPENPNWQSDLQIVGEQNTQAKQTGAAAETKTDIVSRSLVSNYLALKQGGTLNGESAQNLIDQTIEYIDSESATTIKASDLNIVPDDGIRSIEQYGENLGTILKENRPDKVVNEIGVIAEALKTGDQNQLNELDNIISVYKNLNEKIFKMPVPKLFSKSHLDMVNGMSLIILSLEQTKNAFDDPVTSLSTLEKYQEGVFVFRQALQATNIFINQSGIVYKQGTGGYYLIHGI